MSESDRFIDPHGGPELLGLAERYALRYTSAGGTWRLEFFSGAYGEVYRYEGHQLPRKASEWEKKTYQPDPDLETKIVGLAASGKRLDEIARAIHLPSLEVMGIMRQHGYWEY